MGFYKKYVLPKFLNWAMSSSSLRQYRAGVVSDLSGVGLEIGFGSGLNLPYYKNVTKLYSLDPSAEMRALAEQNVVDSLFVVEHIGGVAEHIPLPDSTLDFVVSTWTLCSVANPKLALREIFRVLKPGGKFSFIEHGKSSSALISKIQDLGTPISKCVAGGCHLNRDIDGLILGAGFKVQNLDKFVQKLKPLNYIYKGVVTAEK